MTHILAVLGQGVVLAWLGLPLLVWVTRRDAEAEPASRHRALIGALVLASLLLAVPAIHLLLQASVADAGSRLEAFSMTGLSEVYSRQSGAVAQPWLGAVALPAIGAVWLLLVSARLLSLTRRARHLSRLLSRGQAPSARLHELVALEARSARVNVPEVLVSDEISVPFTARVRQPAIILPSALAESEPWETLRLILRHELGHVARRDVPVDIAVALLLALFTLHPLARSLARGIRFAREAAVDAAVAPSAPGAYASVLVTMAERVQRAGELGVGMDDSDLAARVRRIVEGPRASRRAARRAPLLLAFALLACSGAVAPALDSDSDSEAATQPPAAVPFSVRMVARAAAFDPAAGSGLSSLPLEGEVLGRGDVSGVRVVPAQGDAARSIVLELTPKGQQAIERTSAENVGRRMAMLVGDRVVAAPVIKQPLQGPHVTITTQTEAELDELAAALGAR